MSPGNVFRGSAGAQRGSRGPAGRRGVPGPGSSERPSPAAARQLSSSSTGLLLETNFILLEFSWKGGAGVMETGLWRP